MKRFVFLLFVLLTIPNNVSASEKVEFDNNPKPSVVHQAQLNLEPGPEPHCNGSKIYTLAKIAVGAAIPFLAPHLIKEDYLSSIANLSGFCLSVNGVSELFGEHNTKGRLITYAVGGLVVAVTSIFVPELWGPSLLRLSAGIAGGLVYYNCGINGLLLDLYATPLPEKK